MVLTDPQRLAVEHSGGNLQLIACAGSGKTEVVERRVVYLLTPGQAAGQEPRNIVAFTYTNRAAAELKDRDFTRCHDAFGEMHGLAEVVVYANPDAVRVMTVHQAKGMQWLVVFMPALLKNRFPSRRVGGRSVWHLLPRAGLTDQPRFDGTLEGERRLLVVAGMGRAGGSACCGGAR